MANPEHLTILGLGQVHFNKWRKRHPDIRPDLSQAVISHDGFPASPVADAETGRFNLAGLDLSGADLQQARFVNVDLTAADMTRANLRRARIKNTTLNNADLTGATLANGLIDDADFSDADLSGANMHETVCTRCTFRGATLAEANMVHARMNGLDMQQADMRGATASRAEFAGADLAGARLDGSNLREINFTETYLRGADMHASDLEAARLDRAVLMDADMEGVNLRGASLIRADLRRTRLKRANLRSTTLNRADMRNTDMRDTNVALVRYDRWARYRGIRLNGCYGSPQFKRYALDQEYVEESRGKPGSLRWWLIYLPWLVSSDCGRSLLLWVFWSVLLAVLFGVKYWMLGAHHFQLVHLEHSFSTMLYYSIVTFTTLGFGDVVPTTAEAARWVVAEVVVGYVMLGGLIAIFSNKLARRS